MAKKKVYLTSFKYKFIQFLIIKILMENKIITKSIIVLK